MYMVNKTQSINTPFVQLHGYLLQCRVHTPPLLPQSIMMRLHYALKNIEAILSYIFNTIGKGLCSQLKRKEIFSLISHNFCISNPIQKLEEMYCHVRVRRVSCFPTCVPRFVPNVARFLHTKNMEARVSGLSKHPCDP